MDAPSIPPPTGDGGTDNKSVPAPAPSQPPPNDLANMSTPSPLHPITSASAHPNAPSHAQPTPHPPIHPQTQTPHPPPPSNAAIEEIIARAQALAGSVGPGFGQGQEYPGGGGYGGGYGGQGQGPGQNQNQNQAQQGYLPPFPSYGHQHQYAQPHHLQQHHQNPFPQVHHPFTGPGGGHPGHHVAFNQGGQGQGIGMMGVVPGVGVGGAGGGDGDGASGMGEGGGGAGNGITPQLQGPSAHSLKHKGSYGNGFGGFVTGFHPSAVGADGRVNLFIGNLPFRVRWQDVKDLFRRAGTVLRADVSLDPQTNRSRGYGSVLMGSREDGVKAIELFNGYTWQTRILEVRPDRLPPEYEPQPYIPPSSMAGHGQQQGHPPSRSPYSEFPSEYVPYPQFQSGQMLRADSGMFMASPPITNSSPYVSGIDSTQGTSLSDAISPIPASKAPRGLDRTMSRSPFAPGLSTTPPPRMAGVSSFGLSDGNLSRRGSHVGGALGLDGNVGRSSPAPGSNGSQGSGARRASEASDGAGSAGKTLHVSNIPFQMQWQDLKDLFRTGGNVIRADIAIGPDNRSKGFGTVVFATETDAMHALRQLDGLEHNGRILRVHPDRPQGLMSSPPSGRSTPGGAPPPSSLAPLSYQYGLGAGISGLRQPISSVGAPMTSMGQAFSQGFGGQDPFEMVPSRGQNGATTSDDHLDADGKPEDPLRTPSRPSSTSNQRGPGMGAIGLNRPHGLRTGVPHPGRIVMPTYPNFGQNQMSPLQSGRGMPPMTPSMPGFTFHAYPATPPLHPMSFLSPGLGPFSPTMMTPGSPLNFPSGGFNPFHSPAPGAPIGRQSLGHNGNGNGQAYGQAYGQGYNGNQYGGGNPGYFPHMEDGGGDLNRDGTTPSGPAASKEEVDPFLQAAAKPTDETGHDAVDALGEKIGAVSLASTTDDPTSLSGTGLGTGRDSRASFNMARPEGLSSLSVTRDRRASFDDMKRSIDADV